MAQIEIIAKRRPRPTCEIKRVKAQADIEIAQWKARQWAEIERFKVGLKAELRAAGTGAADPGSVILTGPPGRGVLP